VILPMALEAILKTQNASRETAGRFLILRELVKKIFSLSSCSAPSSCWGTAFVHSVILS
jgi:hypothetical protein